MFQVKLFSLHWTTAIWRFYLLMAIALVAGFSGQYWIGVFVLPVFVSAILGMEIKWKSNKTVTTSRVKSGRIVNMKNANKKAS